jgi:hypothetical protein
MGKQDHVLHRHCLWPCHIRKSKPALSACSRRHWLQHPCSSIGPAGCSSCLRCSRLRPPRLHASFPTGIIWCFGGHMQRALRSSRSWQAALFIGSTASTAGWWCNKHRRPHRAVVLAYTRGEKGDCVQCAVCARVVTCQCIESTGRGRRECGTGEIWERSSTAPHIQDLW